MKKLFSILLVSCLAANAHAQQWSVGTRVGSSYWIRNYDYLLTERNAIGGKRLSIDNGVFVRYETKGRIAYEFGLNNSRLKYQFRPQVDDGPAWAYNDLSYTDNFTTLDASFQVDVTCRHMQACPVLKKFKSFVGITLSPGFLSQRVTAPATERNENIDMRGSTFQVWTSVSHTISYQLSKSFAITSVVNFQLNPESLSKFSPAMSGAFMEPRPGQSFGLRLGAAYNIN